MTRSCPPRRRSRTLGSRSRCPPSGAAPELRAPRPSPTPRRGRRTPHRRCRCPPREVNVSSALARVCTMTRPPSGQSISLCWISPGRPADSTQIPCSNPSSASHCPRRVRVVVPDPGPEVVVSSCCHAPMLPSATPVVVLDECEVVLGPPPRRRQACEVTPLSRQVRLVRITALGGHVGEPATRVARGVDRALEPGDPHRRLGRDAELTAEPLLQVPRRPPDVGRHAGHRGPASAAPDQPPGPRDLRRTGAPRLVPPHQLTDDTVDGREPLRPRRIPLELVAQGPRDTTDDVLEPDRALHL